MNGSSLASQSQKKEASVVVVLSSDQSRLDAAPFVLNPVVAVVNGLF
jgi:hypothetical protein